MAWIVLLVAGLFEVGMVMGLNYSEGFTKLVPSAFVVLGYGTSFWLLALVLRELSVGTTYAVWSAVGTALIAMFGMLALGESANALKVGSLALIILGVVGLNLAGSH